MAEELNKLREYLRHKGLCGLIGGYGSCTCGLEQAEAEAIAAWNTRHPAPPTEAQVEAAAKGIADAQFGGPFNPFEWPEAWEHFNVLARAALEAAGRA